MSTLEKEGRGQELRPWGALTQGEGMRSSLSRQQTATDGFRVGEELRCPE
jgi:hypothetical protein